MGRGGWNVKKGRILWRKNRRGERGEEKRESNQGRAAAPNL